MKLSRCNIIYVFFEATSRVRYELSKLHTLEISPIDLCDTVQLQSKQGILLSVDTTLTLIHEYWSYMLNTCSTLAP